MDPLNEQLLAKQAVDSEPTQPRERKISKGTWFAFGTLALDIIVVGSTFSCLAPIYPGLAESKGVSLSVVGLVFSAYSLINVVAAPIYGRLLQAGVVRRTNALLGGFCVVGLTSMVFATIVLINKPGPFVAVSIVVRMLMGLGATAVDVAAVATVANIFSGTKFLGMAIGIIEAAIGVGLIIGPLVGAFLAAASGFATPFLVTGAVTILLGPIPHFFLNRAEREAAQDANNQKEKSRTGRATFWQIITYLPAVTMLILAMLGSALFNWITPTLAPHMQDEMMLTTATVGAAFATVSGVYAPLSPLMGGIAEFIGPRPAMVAGWLIITASFIMMGPFPGGIIPRSVPLLFVSMALLGLGSVAVFVPTLPVLLEVGFKGVPCHEGLEELMSGAMMSMYYLGGVVGPALGGYLASTLSFAGASTVFAGVALAAALSLLLLEVFHPDMRALRRDRAAGIKLDIHGGGGASAAVEAPAPLELGGGSQADEEEALLAQEVKLHLQEDAAREGAEVLQNGKANGAVVYSSPAMSPATALGPFPPAPIRVSPHN